MTDQLHNRISYAERLNKTKNPLLIKLLCIMLEKKTNLCLSAHLKSIEETLNFIDSIGPHICILKVQIRRFGSHHCNSLVGSLIKLRKKHNFLILEDREFNDLAATVRGQYKGFYVDYANLVTLHPNDATFRAIDEIIRESKGLEDDVRGCLSICEFVYEKPEASNPNKRLDIAVRNSPLCCGIIAQKLRVPDPYNMIKATPGVHLSQSGDGLNQNYNSPSKVVASGADIIIVGRGIIANPREEWLAATLRYKKAAFEAYLDDLGNPNNVGRVSYEDRLDKTQNPLLRKLFKIIVDKHSTLCVAADFNTFEELLDFISQVGDHICILKVQLERFGRESCDHNKSRLIEKKEKYNFLIFEDCKMDHNMSAIGAIYKGFYIDCSDIVTVHPNDVNFEAIKEIIEQANSASKDNQQYGPRACFALCELSYENLEASCANGRCHIATRNTPLCCGIISRQLNVPDQFDMIKVSPEIELARQTGEFEPTELISKGVDIINLDITQVVGNSDWLTTVCRIKENSYQAYLDDLDDLNR